MKFLFFISALTISISSFAALPEGCGNYVKAAANTENAKREIIKKDSNASLFPLGIYMQDDVIPFCEVLLKSELEKKRNISNEEVEHQLSLMKQEAYDLYDSLLID